MQFEFPMLKILQRILRKQFKTESFRKRRLQKIFFYKIQDSGHNVQQSKSAEPLFDHKYLENCQDEKAETLEANRTFFKELVPKFLEIIRSRIVNFDTEIDLALKG